MTYYEELGIGPDATEQEIRKAHRRLVKLMHPDAQPDQNLKMLAETQMRRLNSIVSTLLDSEQRRCYDEELLELAGNTAQRQSFLPAFRGIPWWLASAVGAVVLTLVAVWVWADHMGNGMGSRTRSVYSSGQDRTSVSEAPASGFRPEAGNEIGSASYKPPVTLPDPPANDISTAVVPDLVPETKAAVRTSRLEEHAPESPKKVVAVPVPAAVVPEVKKTAAPAQPKPAEAKPLLVQKSQPKPLLPAAEKKSAVVVAAKASVPDASEKSKLPVTVVPVAVPRKVFNLPPGSSVIASTARPAKSGGQLPMPPSVSGVNGHDYVTTLPPASLPAAAPPKQTAVVTTSANAGGDPLEGEWIYAPKEPEKRKAGFYPPEFIDLKLFGSGDAGNLKGQYSAKYVITDRPVSPEVTFELASVSKGSRRFVWQSSNGARGTLNIDPIDERTIRIDWHTTTAVAGPALTSGTATLVRRQ